MMKTGPRKRAADETFDIEKYTGVWHELLHYPAFFQPSDTYNTTAEYTLMDDNTLSVLNTTYQNGKKIVSYGKAKPMGGVEFRVDFDASDIQRYSMRGFKPPSMDRTIPNYIIRHIWKDSVDDDEYKFAVVTDRDAESLWVLSRVPNPSRAEYEEVLNYVTTNFDRKRLVATPHYL